MSKNVNQKIMQEILEILLKIKLVAASENADTETDTDSDDVFETLCQQITDKSMELEADTTLIGTTKNTITINYDDLQKIIQQAYDAMLMQYQSLIRYTKNIKKMKELQKKYEDEIRTLQDIKKNEVTMQKILQKKIDEYDDKINNVDKQIAKVASTYFKNHVKILNNNADKKAQEQIEEEMYKQICRESDMHVQRILRDLDDER